MVRGSTRFSPDSENPIRRPGRIALDVFRSTFFVCGKKVGRRAWRESELAETTYSFRLFREPRCHWPVTSAAHESVPSPLSAKARGKKRVTVEISAPPRRGDRFPSIRSQNIKNGCKSITATGARGNFYGVLFFAACFRENGVGTLTTALVLAGQWPLGPLTVRIN